jgi:hypothetical protein
MHVAQTPLLAIVILIFLIGLLAFGAVLLRMT